MPRQGIAPAPRGLPQVPAHLTAGAGTGHRRLSGGYPDHTFRRLGFRQSSFRHMARIPRRTAPYAWARSPVSWPAIPLAFGSRVSHQIQRRLLQSLPATRAIQQCASWRTQVAGLLGGPSPGWMRSDAADADAPGGMLDDGQDAGPGAASRPAVKKSTPGSPRPGSAGTATRLARSGAARDRCRHSSEFPTLSTPLRSLTGGPARRESGGSPIQGSPGQPEAGPCGSAGGGRPVLPRMDRSARWRR